MDGRRGIGGAARIRSAISWLVVVLVGAGGRAQEPPANQGPSGTLRLTPSTDSEPFDIEALPYETEALPRPFVLWRRWATDAGSEQRSSPPFLLDPVQKLVIQLDAGSREVVAIGAEDGRQRWSAPLSSEVRFGEAAFLVADRERIFAIWGDEVRALRLVDGAREWQIRLDGSPFASPVIAGDHVILRLPVAGTPGDPDRRPEEREAAKSLGEAQLDEPPTERVVAVNTATGALDWATEPERWSPHTQVVAGGDLVIGLRMRSRIASAGDMLFGQDDAPVATYAPCLLNNHVTGKDAVLVETEVTVRESHEGTVEAITRLAGLVDRPAVATGEQVIVTVTAPLFCRDGAFGHVAYRLPSLERLGTTPVSSSSWIALTPDGKIEIDAYRVRRLEPSSGVVLATSDLLGLHHAFQQATSAFATAGERLLLAVSGEDDDVALVTLDADTLRPLGLHAGLVGEVESLQFAAGLAVLRIGSFLVAIDPSRTVPSPLAELPPAARFERLVAMLDAGEIWVHPAFPDGNRRLARLVGDLARLEEPLVPVLLAALDDERESAALAAAAVARYRPDPLLVPALVAAAEPPADAEFPCPYPGEYCWGRSALTRMLVAAIVAARDTRAIDLLDRIMDGASDDAELRWIAMGGLTDIGTSEALGQVDAWRGGTAAIRDPWYPRRHRDWMYRQIELTWDSGTELAGSRLLALRDFEVPSGVCELWLYPAGDPGEHAVFAGVVGSACEDAVGATGDAAGLRVVVHHPEREASPAGWPPPAPASEEVFELEWHELRRDSDGDGWTDRLERRLRTSPDDPDSDTDGLADPVDPAPRSPSFEAEGCTKSAAATAAFLFRSTFFPDYGPVFLVGPNDLNGPYSAPDGPVFYISEAELDDLVAESDDYVAAAAVEIGPWPEDIARMGAGDEIGVTFGPNRYWEGCAVGSFETIKLRCLGDRWYPVSSTGG
ncbi:MAG: PQQ-binding-like beta-propeller repeat protein [Deltaproteobacteria bacterium]|nr:PQQ-binding-like beta-propeller repeat protein [Deltaproteobacteria bacterium]